MDGATPLQGQICDLPERPLTEALNQFIARNLLGSVGETSAAKRVTQQSWKVIPGLALIEF